MSWMSPSNLTPSPFARYFPRPTSVPRPISGPYPVTMNIVNVFPPYPIPHQVQQGSSRTLQSAPVTQPRSLTWVERVVARGMNKPAQVDPIEEEKQPREAEVEEEESLSKVQESKSCKALFKGHSYNYRNVYKSIMRNMYTCLRKNREELSEILTRNGYTMSNIEHAYYKIDSYHESERKKGKKKVAQTYIQKMLTIKTIYTYILQEALYAMLSHKEKGKLGRVDEKNFELYAKVCAQFYEETIKLIGHPAQGQALQL